MKRLRTIGSGVLGVLGALVGTAPATPGFTDVTASSGVDFVHSNGATGEKQYIEVMGSGVALLDYDGDTRLDLYFVTSVGPNRLYRNQGGLKFTDVTDRARVGDEGYGMGATAADIDGDGDMDVYVTNVGPNRLLRNRGNGTFEEVAEELGVDDTRWGAGSTVLDYDGDGRLDIYVTNYVTMAVPDSNVCRAPTGERLYCPPRAYPRERDVLYRQRDDGRFEDVTDASGVGTVIGRGLGATTLDYDGDGWTDIYVANDLDRNFLFRNRGDGTFEEMGLMSGVSHSEDGMEESGMGIAIGDYDRDGRPDIFVTNYLRETNTLYRNEGDGFYLDESARAHLADPSLPWIGWGVSFLDYDLDGWLDLMLVNGHTDSDAAIGDPTTSWKQPGLLFHNRGHGRFEEVARTVAPALAEPRAGRGAAFGDLDDDGDLDVVIATQNGPALVLECTGAREGVSWIGIDPRGASPNPDAIGAQVVLWARGEAWQDEVRAGESYLSTNDRRLLFTLPPGASPDSVVVRWPGGGREVLRGLDVGCYHVVREDGSP